MKEKETTGIIPKKPVVINIPWRYLGVVFFAVVLVAYKIYNYYSRHGG